MGDTVETHVERPRWQHRTGDQYVALCHYPQGLAGKVCTCPPDCSTTERWGAGPRDCDPNCEPCRIMAGREYHKPPKNGSAS